MTTLYEAAYAKVNLTLNVLGKREDGYHDLQSASAGTTGSGLYSQRRRVRRARCCWWATC